MTSPDAGTLTERRLSAATTEKDFVRGEDYVRYVRGMQVHQGRARGTIQAKNVYVVDLDWSKVRLAGACTCPHHAGGAFCKHLVALGLAAIDAGHGEPTAPAGSVAPDVARLVGELDLHALRELVAEIATRDPDTRRLLELRSASLQGDPTRVGEELLARAKKVFAVRGEIDYRRSFEVASDAQRLLDDLERHLDAGGGAGADAARPALLRALTRLRQLTLRADDSGGVLGDACQRAADLHARSCVAGTPERTKLARWLLSFRADSPGWPETPLADHVGAFDDKALAAYRAGVEKLDEQHRDTEHWRRFGVDQMLLELADHDGDTDRAVEVLSGGDHPQYGAIVSRLLAAARDDEALAWTDRAVAAGRVGGQGVGGYTVDVLGTCEAYRAAHRLDEAIALLRDEFAKRPGAVTLRQLVTFVDRDGLADRERDWAHQRARELAGERFGSGAALIDMALAEEDLDAAWEAAHAFGAGHLWQVLAQVGAAERPGDAALLYRPWVEKELVHPKSSAYPTIASTLATMRDLHLRAGEGAEFAAYVANIRETFGRRPSLMAALDRQGL